MKIFFSHRMLGESENAQLCEQIIDLLSEYGEVLTERLSENGNISLRQGMESTYVFEQDVDWLRDADVVIAEVSTPSIGVGYEVGLAESLEKRILCLYREKEDQKLSTMISGNRNLSIAQYESIHDIEMFLIDFF